MNDSIKTQIIEDAPMQVCPICDIEGCRHIWEAAHQTAQCCMCGKHGLSTAEDGGPECELDDGRWVCSRECYDRAVDGVTVQDAARWLLIADLSALIEGPMSDAVDETDEGTWIDEDRGACVGSAALMNAWTAALHAITEKKK